MKDSIFNELSTTSVYAFRMVTGEEIIAKVKPHGDDDPCITIISPRVLIAQLRQKPDGTPIFAAQILNWINSAPDADVKIYSVDVVTVAPVDTEIEKEYIRFTTGIQLIG